MTLSLERAHAVVHKALEAAAAQSVDIVAVVVDRSGYLIAAARMDGVGYMNLKAAQKKAATAASFAMSTQDLSIFASKDEQIGKALTADEEILLLPGAIPITDGETPIGALGIAGGHYSQDHAIATYAIEQDKAQTEDGK